MDMFLTGLFNLMVPQNILLMVIGVVIGIIFGSVPGLSSTMAIALFLPVTFGLDVYGSFALLCALYIGGVSGGLISAILINIPGTSMSIATTYDGYPMAQKGQAHKALGTGIFFSFAGTIFGIVVLLVAAPSLAAWAVKLGAYEYFALSFFALTLIAGIAGKDVIKSMMAGLLGMALTMVGVAPIDGAIRFTFGNNALVNGFDLLPAVLGLFAVTEIMLAATKPIGKGITSEDLNEAEKVRGFGFSVKEGLAQTKNFILSSVIGVFVGFLPGMGGSLANQVAYVAIQKTSKYPEKFGTGIMDGVVATETSNNASIGGAMIPLLALGIPGDGPTAMLLGAFMIHGLVAGPMLFTTSADLVYTIFVALLICTVLMLIIEFCGLRLFTKALLVPKGMLLPMVLTICMVGAFASGNKMFNVWTMLIFGIIGFSCSKLGVPRAPMVLGFVLGEMVETNFRRAMQLSQGSFVPFFTRPVSCVLLVIALVVLTISIVKQFRRKELVEDEDD